eukprot:CFRG1503T1
MAALGASKTILEGIDVENDLVSDDMMEVYSEVTKSNLDGSWDYMLLVMTWPETFCEETYSCRIPTKVKGFSLHGLWPERLDGTWPQYCPGPRFSKLSMLKLLPRLLRLWANMLPKRPMYSFWEHEWTRHGKCAIQNNPRMTTQHSYFKHALDLFKKYDPLKVWQKAGMSLPSNSNQFSIESLITTYKNNFGVAPVIACGHQRKDHDYIDQVTVCIDKMLQIQECPMDIKRRSCPHGSNLLLPILNYK